MGVARVPRLRIVTALLVALILVSIVPLALLHFSLIGINRDALETAEKKYLKNSSVTLAESFDTYITNAQSQLKKIADGIRLASSMSTDPFFYLSKKQLLREYSDAESSFPVLRALDRDGVVHRVSRRAGQYADGHHDQEWLPGQAWRDGKVVDAAVGAGDRGVTGGGFDRFCRHGAATELAAGQARAMFQVPYGWFGERRRPGGAA